MTDYDKLQAQHPDFDPLIQMQLDEFTGAMRRATNTLLAIGIVETDGATQIAISTTGPNRLDAQAHSLVVLVQAAGGAVQEKSGGTIELVLKMSDGSLVPAIPEHVRPVMQKVT